jgi:hypothetical protein
VWSPLRLAYQAAFTTAHFATYPGVAPAVVKKGRCFARSQMAYVSGDNPEKLSYVVGFGQAWPGQVHHRDSACTLEEAIAGECVQPCVPLSPAVSALCMHACALC